jgi:hypothetical protein
VSTFAANLSKQANELAEYFNSLSFSMNSSLAVDDVSLGSHTGNSENNMREGSIGCGPKEAARAAAASKKAARTAAANAEAAGNSQSFVALAAGKAAAHVVILSGGTVEDAGIASQEAAMAEGGSAADATMAAGQGAALAVRIRGGSAEETGASAALAAIAVSKQMKGRTALDMTGHGNNVLLSIPVPSLPSLPPLPPLPDEASNEHEVGSVVAHSNVDQSLVEIASSSACEVILEQGGSAEQATEAAYAVAKAVGGTPFARAVAGGIAATAVAKQQARKVVAKLLREKEAQHCAVMDASEKAHSAALLAQEEQMTEILVQVVTDKEELHAAAREAKVDTTKRPTQPPAIASFLGWCGQEAPESPSRSGHARKVSSNMHSRASRPSMRHSGSSGSSTRSSSHPNEDNAATRRRLDAKRRAAS